MTVRECYAAMGGDYEEALSLLGSEERIRRYLLRFAVDPTAALLFHALAQGEGQTAFGAAHTLKGVCHCLGMTRLYDSSYALTEVLRAGLPHDGALLNRVHQDYETVIRAVHGLGGGR